MPALRSLRHSVSRRKTQLESLESRLLMAVLPVLNNNATGAGSLFQVTAGASNGDTIDLSNLSGEIDLSSTLGPITKSLTFVGPGSDVLTIHGDTIFSLASTASISVSNLTLAGSNVGAPIILNSHGSVTLNNVVLHDSTGGTEGGAIDTANGTLSVTDCTFINNSSLNGGAIHSQGDQVIIDSCTFVNNTATKSGSAQGFGGALSFRLVNYVLINRSTFTANTAGNWGGAIYVEGGGTPNSTEAAGTITLDDLTITNNFANYGGGLLFNSFQGAATIVSNIIAGNHATTLAPDFQNLPDDISIVAKHNLIGSDDFGPALLTPLFVDGTNSNIVGPAANPIDPHLGPLADNGGPTQTMMLLPASQAINNGDPSWTDLTDQRGFDRQMPYDIGAVESPAPHFTGNLVTGTLAHHTLNADIGGTDPNDLPLTFSVLQGPAWFGVVDHGDGTATLTGTPGNADVGLSDIILRVSDGTYYAEEEYFFDVGASNTAPTFPAVNAPDATQDSPYTLTVSASDGDSDALTFSAPTLPDWLTLTDNGNGTATLTGTPSETDVFAVTLRVSDGAATTDRSFNIFVQGVNHAPSFTNPPQTIVFNVNQEYTENFTATDADNDHLTITATGLPDWMDFIDFGNGTATIIADPTRSAVVLPAHTTDYDIALHVSDGTTTTDLPLHTQVTEANAAPVFISALETSLTTNLVFNDLAVVTDANGDAITITALALPSWVIFKDNGDGTASLTGTPVDGSAAVTLRASDGFTTTDLSYTLTVTEPSNHTPTFTSTPPATATLAGNRYTYNIIAYDADGDPLTITITNKPAWLTFTDHGDGTATLTGTPSNADAGTPTVFLHLTDSHGSGGDQQVPINVSTNDAPPVFASATDPTSADALVAFTRTFSVTNFRNLLATFSLIDAPSWLQLTDNQDNTVTLSGTPETTDMGQTQSITIAASSDTGTVNKTFALTIPAFRFRLDNNGTLAIVGTNDADQIFVNAISGNTMRVSYNGTLKNFPLASVKSVQVYGQDGDDVVILNTGSIPTYVLGGAGADALIGGDEADNLVGGGGKDDIEGNAGDDRLSGLDGNDYILGGGGADRIYGGNGSDYIVGGTGADRIWGEAGSDTILAKDKFHDQLYADSASATDSAQVDALDTLNGIFDLVI